MPRRLAVVALGSVLRAIFGYYFLVLVVRIVGRRPGKQLTPFEFVLIFFLGGLMLTGIVANEMSLANAVCQIIAISVAHYALVWIRMRSSRVSRFLDGTPLILMEGGHWRSRTMRKMRISYSDVMAMGRDQGLKTFDEMGTVTLERNGEMSILPAEDQNQ
ncbi:DUF421 domain-containing protein [Terriglobus aquaticus]|uniref:DUF421 domain-containing protein n=1 Tax=Terriglobus aquaticus TaxID=940139 RepID=A0ABW9KMY5_9BACT|nr:YetF domain-containing protein [Terriglobus aquaticus]